MVKIDDFLTKIRWDDRGLIPAIVQSVDDNQVLMLAWMNLAALQESLASGRTVFWSRSRQELWRKGETSGNVQQLQEVHLDCDEDCLLLRVRQQGSGACHTGRPSCFYRQLAASGWVEMPPGGSN